MVRSPPPPNFSGIKQPTTKYIFSTYVEASVNLDSSRSGKMKVLARQEHEWCYNWCLSWYIWLCEGYINTVPYTQQSPIPKFVQYRKCICILNTIDIFRQHRECIKCTQNHGRWWWGKLWVPLLFPNVCMMVECFALSKFCVYIYKNMHYTSV